MVPLRGTILARAKGSGTSGYGLTRIVIDSAGNVVDVTPSDSSAQAVTVAECIRSALAGLNFPCLAGSQV